jgi:hypothetical protein
MTFVQLRDAILALVATRSLAERWSEVELPKLAHRELDLADDAPIPPELPDGKAADIAAAYIEALHLKFADQRLDDLGKLHQVKMRERGENRETPSQYHARFENVAAQLRGLSDRQKVEAFLLGLPEGLVGFRIRLSPTYIVLLCCQHTCSRHTTLAGSLLAYSQLPTVCFAHSAQFLAHLLYFTIFATAHLLSMTAGPFPWHRHLRNGLRSGLLATMTPTGL